MTFVVIFYFYIGISVLGDLMTTMCTCLVKRVQYRCTFVLARECTMETPGINLSLAIGWDINVASYKLLSVLSIDNFN